LVQITNETDSDWREGKSSRHLCMEQCSNTTGPRGDSNFVDCKRCE